MAFGKMQRRPELDALRGLFLVWMTLTHLPTRMSEFVNQPFGFVSSAEGFVFLSALLVARLYSRQAAQDEAGLRAKLWKRALKIYGIHLAMVALAFTIAAGLAVTTHRAAIYNLLDFYIAHPATAILGSVLLLYCPPLLDILPMYVIFLAFSPLVLSFGVRYGWRRMLAGSGLVWLSAQLGGREFLHAHIVRITHLHIPQQEAGAFNLLAWQAVWFMGLWLGAKSAEGEVPLKRLPGWTIALSAAACIFFAAVRHQWLGPRLTQTTLAFQVDKWHIGPLRALNLIAFTIVFYWLRRLVFPLVAIEPFLTLGKASLEVFCAHIIFVFLGLALLYNDVAELHGWKAILLLIVTFSGLFLLAANEVRKRAKRKRESSGRPGEPSLKPGAAPAVEGEPLRKAACPPVPTL
ncbi:MAG TPA: OpgC domain-containing protein [Acidobacteriaceae bacterium]